MRTQVGIVGAGPAGLLLSHLLHLQGIESVVLEARNREYVEGRLRAGLLEQGTADLLRTAGVGERMEREGLVQDGFELRFGGQRHRIDLKKLTGGYSTMVYGQQEIVKDLINARLQENGQLIFSAEVSEIQDLNSKTPSIHYWKDGAEYKLQCDYVAGCDGFHGPSRTSIPEKALTVYERSYPFAWLGILAEAPPPSKELIYVYHKRGFALLSMRSPELSRSYIQCRPEEKIDNWSHERIWEELQTRLATDDGGLLSEGPIIKKDIVQMRSFLVEPMQYGRLFLAGDAAHVVPPSAAKGMNTAVSDVQVLAEALTKWYVRGRDDLLDGYSATCLRHVWRAQRFSNVMTSMLHRFEDDEEFDYRLQLTELEYLCASETASASLAQRYVGLHQL